jgi:phage protein D/phage baseplate assembly protein gpV
MSNVATPLDSPNVRIVDVKVFINDQVIDRTIQITEVAIFKRVNKIGKADVYLMDGDVAEGTFPLMESSQFVPGTPIKIEIGYGTGEENEIAFQGIIVQVDVKTSSESRPLLIVRCVCQAFLLTSNNQYCLYENKKDSDLFRDIIDRYPKVDAGDIDSTSYSHPSIIQFGINDWDFLLSRARRIGHIVYSEGGKLNVKKPENQEKTIKATFGKDIIRQQLSFTARSVFPGVAVNSWNAADQELRTENEDEIPIPQPGNGSVDTSDVASKFTNKPQTIVSHADLDTQVISDLASAQFLAYELNKIHGYIVIPGSNAPKLNSVLEIDRMGNYFSGDAYISGLEHHIKEGKWTTKILVGLKQEIDQSGFPFDGASATDVNTLVGLHVGIVKQIHDDPAGSARILVKIPGLEGDSEGVWARVLQRYASNGAGAVVFPELGNEVVLGFLSGDPHAPVALGSLFSQTNPPPRELKEGNPIKAFYSREQLTCSFDEEKKEICVFTPGRNKLKISDDLKGIRLEDQNGNSLTLNDKGVAIESKTDLIIKTAGKVLVESTGNLNLSAKSGDASLQAMNVKIKANVRIEEQANIIESRATAQAVIKGGIVQIN